MRLIAALALLLTASCAGLSKPLLSRDGTDLIGAPGVYTLVNLHPDETQNRLYAVNYQLQGLIPMCSEVELLEFNGKALKFKVRETAKVYSYLYHKAAAEAFEDHLRRFFGTECNEDAVQRLGDTDREGIRSGKVSIGMSKEAIVYALGPPPRHVTPSLEADRWTYWLNRFKRMVVVFENDVVSEIVL